MELARRKHECGVVLNIFPAHLARFVHRELHRLPGVADGMLEFVLHHADDVDGSAIFILVRDKRNLRTWNHE